MAGTTSRARAASSDFKFLSMRVQSVERNSTTP
jgi:hypothetical protein